MPIVFNATDEKQSIKACGKWFTFAPKALKRMDEHLCRFISEERKQFGLVVLPAEFEDPETESLNSVYLNSEDGKAKLEELRELGINNLIAFHREIIRNNQVSLRRDLGRAEMNVDPAIEASAGELESMRLVAKYIKSKEDTEQKRIDEVKELLKKVGPIGK